VGCEVHEKVIYPSPAEHAIRRVGGFFTFNAWIHRRFLRTICSSSFDFAPPLEERTYELVSR
jgi:hypothetical protein